MPKPSMRGVLIEAGLTEFRGRGYSATGVQAITDRAGAPRGSFYGHFSSKESFALEVLDHYEQWYVSATDRPDLRGQARLRFEFGLLLQTAEETGFELGCLWGMFGAEVRALSPTVGHAVHQAVDRWAERLANYLTDAYEDAGRAAPDTVALAHHLVAAWEGALWRARLAGTTRSLSMFMEYTLGPVLAAATPAIP
jgi:TetR/AcrR family transcriptional regulator, transcriptional repressor for nem operon